jgi:hypothetical protein
MGLAEPDHFGAEPDRPTLGAQMIMQHLLELILATDGEPGGVAAETTSSLGRPRSTT